MLTKNVDRYFIQEGYRPAYFRLAYEPGNVDTALEEYQKWCKKLVEHDWPYCFGVPKVTAAVNCYHTPVSDVDIHDEDEKKEDLEKEANDRYSEDDTNPVEDTGSNVNRKYEQESVQHASEIDPKLKKESKHSMVEKESTTHGLKRVVRKKSGTLTLSNTLVVNQQISVEKRSSRRNNNSRTLILSKTLITHQPTSAEKPAAKISKYSKILTRSQSRTLTMSNTLIINQKSSEEKAKHTAKAEKEVDPVEETVDPLENNGDRLPQTEPADQKNESSHSTQLKQPNQENSTNESNTEPIYTLDQLDLTNIPQSWRDIVTIAPSKITNAGNGLFATRTLPYNTPIGFYFGVPMTEDEFDSLKDRVGRSSEYSIMYRRTVLDATDDQGEPITDASSPRFCPFHFMNETTEQTEASVAFVEGFVVNQVICWTRKKIEPGEELLVWYGAEVNRYWQQK